MERIANIDKKWVIENLVVQLEKKGYLPFIIGDSKSPNKIHAIGMVMKTQKMIEVNRN